MRIRDQLVNSRDKTWSGLSQITSITVHETANTSRGANAAAHANLQSRGNPRQASWHYQVDDTEIVRSFPDTVRCWHAGPAAAHSIAIEICVNSDGDYNKALENAAWLVRHLRAKHGLGRADVKQHFDWTGKHCPAKLRVSRQWAQFVASTDPAKPAPTPKVTTPVGPAAAKGGGRSVEAMAREILAGKHGNGHATRQRSLGISKALYTKVRAEVNRLARVPTQRSAGQGVRGRTISQMATEVLQGRHGNGHETRRKSLGISQALYQQVRAEVNRRAR